jgi:hypothetical protein
MLVSTKQLSKVGKSVPVIVGKQAWTPNPPPHVGTPTSVPVAMNVCDAPAAIESLIQTSKLLPPAPKPSGLAEVNPNGDNDSVAIKPGESTPPVFETVASMKAFAGAVGSSGGAWRATTPVRYT